MDDLDRLDADIDTRVFAIRAGAPDWPCARGCDDCCRRLADVPSLTETEWERLREGLAALPEASRERIFRAVAALRESPARPVVCPLLDRETGACPVYAHRPMACRTYGFYVQRDRGLYCHAIEARVTAGALADTVWGNHDAVDRRLAALGRSRPLTEWFSRQDFSV